MANNNLFKTVIIQATDTDGIVASQVLAAGALTIGGAFASGGVATMSAAQIVSFTVTNDQTGCNFLITGTNANGNPMTETVAGTNGSVSSSTRYFKTVSSIVASGTITGASTVRVGTTSTDGAVSATLSPNWRSIGFKASVAVTIGTSATYTVQHTFDDVTDLSVVPVWFDHDELKNMTVSDDGNYLFAVRGVRLRVTAAVGTVKITMLQGNM